MTEMDDDFACQHCHRVVSSNAPGTEFRNHCPACLWSLHVAESTKQDDRRSSCLGSMKPIAISEQAGGEWFIVHQCETCDVVRLNRIAGDDDMVELICIALRPLSSLPVPLEHISREARLRYQAECDDASPA